MYVTCTQHSSSIAIFFCRRLLCFGTFLFASFLARLFAISIGQSIKEIEKLNGWNECSSNMIHSLLANYHKFSIKLVRLQTCHVRALKAVLAPTNHSFSSEFIRNLNHRFIFYWIFFFCCFDLLIFGKFTWSVMTKIWHRTVHNKCTEIETLSPSQWAEGKQRNPSKVLAIMSTNRYFSDCITISHWTYRECVLREIPPPPPSLAITTEIIKILEQQFDRNWPPFIRYSWSWSSCGRVKWN